MIEVSVLIKLLILQHLNDWDLMGLSPARTGRGAPFDEYMSYAVKLQQQFETSSAISARKLAELIAAEFSRGFGENFEVDAELEEMATDILFHINLLRKNVSTK